MAQAQYPPFPIDAYPELISKFCERASADIGCPRDYLCAGILAVAGTALGADVRLYLGGEWEERPCFWVALVGESGTKKNPPIKVLCKRLRELDTQKSTEFRVAMTFYTAQDAAYKRDTPKPIRQTIITGNATVEGARNALVDNPRGILWATGEIVGWIESMGQYKGGKGSDRQTWLDIYSEDPMNDLRAGVELPLTVPKPFVSILGGIQPGVLSKLSGKDGLRARLLIVPGEAPEDIGLPPSPETDGIGSLYESTVGYEVWHNTVDKLLTLRPGGQRLTLAPDCRVEADRWLRKHNKQCRKIENQDQRELCSKIQGLVFRVAIVLWALDYTCQGDSTQSISVKQFQRAVEIVDWAMATSDIALAMMDPTSTSDDEWNSKLDSLRRWLIKHPNASKSMMLTRGPNGLRKASLLNEALRSFGWSELSGTGVWVPNNTFIKDMAKAGSHWDKSAFYKNVKEDFDLPDQEG